MSNDIINAEGAIKDLVLLVIRVLQINVSRYEFSVLGTLLAKGVCHNACVGGIETDFIYSTVLRLVRVFKHSNR